MTRRGVNLGVAVILLLLIYVSAMLLFDRTNPAREIPWIPFPDPLNLKIGIRGG